MGWLISNATYGLVRRRAARHKRHAVMVSWETPRFGRRWMCMHPWLLCAVCLDTAVLQHPQHKCWLVDCCYLSLAVHEEFLNNFACKRGQQWWIAVCLLARTDTVVCGC